MAIPSTHLPAWLRGPRAGAVVIADLLAALGRQLRFYAAALAATPRTLTHYRREVARLIAEISLGSGALLVGGGTVGVIFMLSFFTGTEVGLQGFRGLQIIGLAPLAGLVSAFANTREIAPIVAGVALAAQVGCGFTAQLGAMRIAEEIDALEVIPVRPLPYLVTTRMIAAFVAVIPLYMIGLLASYFATQVSVVYVNHQSIGTYSYYFHLFLPPIDVLYSLLKVLVFAVIVTLVHCYYGYYATGGPEGVGRAAGRALRTSIVLINVTDLFLTLLFWGAHQTVQISG